MPSLNDQTIDKLAELKARERELQSQENPPRLVVEDITSPKLAILMQQNRDVMASLSPDARGAGKVLLGRYNDGSIDADMFRQSNHAKIAVGLQRRFCLQIRLP